MDQDTQEIQEEGKEEEAPLGSNTLEGEIQGTGEEGNRDREILGEKTVSVGGGEFLVPSTERESIGGRARGGSLGTEGGELLEAWEPVSGCKRGPKLSDDQQAFICQCLAEGKTQPEIVSLLKSRYGVEITLEGVAWYRRNERWAQLTAELREAWTAKLADEPAANKRTRLTELWSLYEEERGEGRNRNALAVLEAIRREMEGPDVRGGGGAEVRVYLGSAVKVEVQGGAGGA